MTWKHAVNRVLERRLATNIRRDVHWSQWERKDRHLFLYKYLASKSNVELMQCMQIFALHNDDLSKMLADMFLDSEIENVFSSVQLSDRLKKHVLEYFEDDINDKIDEQYQEYMKSKTDYIFNPDTLVSYDCKHGE